MKTVSCKCNELGSLAKVSSASLRSLYIDGTGAKALLALFVSCLIDRVTVNAKDVHEVAKLFPGTRDLRIRVSLSSISLRNQYLAITDIRYIQNSFPEVLIEPAQEGRSMFPKLEQITLLQTKDDSEKGVLHIQTLLLQFMSYRNSNATVSPIRIMRIPRNIVTSTQFQEKLEECVSSLVIIVGTYSIIFYPTAEHIHYRNLNMRYARLCICFKQCILA